MLQGADELSRADEYPDQAHLPSRQPPEPSSPTVMSSSTSSPDWPAPTPACPAASVEPSPAPAPAPAAADLVARLAGGEARQEFVVAREIRAAGLVGGLSTAQIAVEIHDRCSPAAATSLIR